MIVEAIALFALAAPPDTAEDEVDGRAKQALELLDEMISRLRGYRTAYEGMPDTETLVRVTDLRLKTLEDARRSVLLRRDDFRKLADQTAQPSESRAELVKTLRWVRKDTVQRIWDDLMNAVSATAKAEFEAERRGMLNRVRRRWLTFDALYIATPEELLESERLDSPEAAMAFVEKFWKKRDPDPKTEANEFRREHYRRVWYANKQFRDGETPGSLTPRGKQYILTGSAPSEAPIR